MRVGIFGSHLYNENGSHYMGGWIVSSLASSRYDRGMGNSVGAIATIAVHVLALLFFLSSKSEQAPPAPTYITTRVISDAPEEQAKPEPLRAEPVLNQPKLNVPLPEVVLTAEAPAANAPVAVTSAPPSSAPSQPQQVVDSVPRFDADYLNNPAPGYPALSRRLREQGVVLLRVYVLPSGSPEQVELKQSSGSARLDESALTAVRKWRFTPAQSAGRAVAAWVVVPIAFSLST